MAYNRVTELYIGTFPNETNVEDGFLVDSLDYEFEIKRSAEFYKDSATFTIHNPNQETISAIMDYGRSVIFKAGYENETIGTIFVGQIAYAYPESESPDDVRLVVICNSTRGAQFPLQRTFVTAFIDEGKSYYDVLKTIADYVGIPVSGAEVLKSRKLDAGYIINGSIRDEVINFTQRKLRAIGGKVIISNNELVYIDNGTTAIFETVYLTFESGLVSATPLRDEKYQSSEDAFQENSEYYLGLKAQGDTEVAKEKARQASVQARNEVSFTALIIPSLQIGSPVNIDARINHDDHIGVVGKFYIQELTYNGDNYGNQFQVQGKAIEKVQ